MAPVGEGYNARRMDGTRGSRGRQSRRRSTINVSRRRRLAGALRPRADANG